MFETILSKAEYLVWTFGIPVGGEEIPIVVIALLGTGFFLTLRLGFLQIRALGHGFAVATGRWDDPDAKGDVSHFQALTTALSATVGIGNIAGVAIAIHFGGPGALFWMWMTAALGMVVKYVEVTLAMMYREVEDPDDKHPSRGTVSGGPMYYIEKGLGRHWRPVASFYALVLIAVSLLGSNATQANTIADNLKAEFGLEPWVSGLVTATIVALVTLGGIRRIGRVTSILAPSMAVLYVAGALLILGRYYEAVPAALALIVREAFHPTAGVAGTGAGVFVATMMWGVRRGLFSNEAGQGSAPIAHAAAQTDEPVAEGVVALIGPFIDTIVICTMTGLALIVTGVWKERIPSVLELQGGDSSYVQAVEGGVLEKVETPERMEIRDGEPVSGIVRFAWHEVPVERLFVDPEHQRPFTGILYGQEGRAVTGEGEELARLYGLAAESGAPLTRLAFERALGPWGRWIVVVSVFLFGLSTAISWSYYGDRSVKYLFGGGAILPYKIVFVGMHFTGAVFAMTTVWRVGDVATGLVTFPNLLALLLLSGSVAAATRSYFQRRPWQEREKKATRD